MVIRTFEHDDIEIVKEITKECAPYLGLYPDYIYWLYENLYNETCFICEENGKVQGFLTCLPDPKHNAIFAWQLGVRKDFRKRGAAYLLLKTAWEKASELGFSGIITSICSDNQASLNSFGKIGKEYGLSPHKIGIYEWQGVLTEDVLLWN